MVLVHGLFSCWSWPNTEIFNLKLVFTSEENGKVVADRGYAHDGWVTPQLVDDAEKVYMLAGDRNVKRAIQELKKLIVSTRTFVTTSMFIPAKITYVECRTSHSLPLTQIIDSFWFFFQNFDYSDVIIISGHSSVAWKSRFWQHIVALRHCNGKMDEPS